MVQAPPDQAGKTLRIRPATDDLDAAGAEQVLETLPQQELVFCKEHAHGARMPHGRRRRPRGPRPPGAQVGRAALARELPGPVGDPVSVSGTRV
ncbi:hypothetical protein GCM10022275_06200 [Tessaracoccus defluvii]